MRKSLRLLVGLSAAIVAVGSLATLLARQRDKMASSWQAVRREAAACERAFVLQQESEERFRLLADSTPALVWISGPDKSHTYFNRAWLEFTGRTLEQERGTGWLEGVHPADAPGCLADYVAAFDSRREFSLEYRLRHRDGTFRWVLDRGAPSFAADGQLAGYVGVAMDVTALKRAEEAQRLAVLRERERLARDLHDAVTQTLFSMSLIADVLPRLWERQPAEGRRRLDELRQLTRGALLEMRTLLLELRPEGPGAVPLGDLLRQLADTMAARAQLPVSFVAVGQLPPLPVTVHVALYRIAHEALNNAARHARATRITVHLRGGPDELELIIADDGRGFEAAGVPGGHLGIEVIRERAAGIGATATIESRVGRGTWVAVVWPVSADEDSQ